MHFKDQPTQDDELALMRIQQAQAKHSTRLDLTDLLITHLPPEITVLTQLEHLDLSGCTQLEDLSPLSHLSHLKVLVLKPNRFKTRLTRPYYFKLTNLQPLSELKTLHTLTLSGCNQLDDLSPVANLQTLQQLDLSGFQQLSDLSPLANLQALQQLDLRGCQQLRDFSPLANLTALQQLDLRKCEQLSDLSPLTNLTALQQLDLSGCQQLSDLSPLAGLPQLHTLKLDTSLDCSPSAVPLNTWPALQELHCQSLLSAPSELGSNKQEYLDNCLPRIRQWQQDLQHGEAPASATKVVIIGNGRVGKTQLCRRLQGLGFDTNIPSTHGIALQECLLSPAMGEQPAVSASLWDFGGQDIYLGTHSLFLDERAIYVLAWTPQHENSHTFEEHGVSMRNRPLSYWLAFIHSTAGSNAPLIVVQTQCDDYSQEQSIDIPEHLSFQWTRTIHASALNEEGVEELEFALKKAAKRQLAQYKKVRLPQSWVDVGQALRADASIKTVAYESFVDLCKQHKIAAPEAVLAYLHRSGQVFWQHGIFDNHIVVDLSWALQGLYALHHREQSLPYLKQDYGRFRLSDLSLRIWRDYSDEERKLFLSLMQQCHICFPLKKLDEHDNSETLYLAPEFLPTIEQCQNKINQYWRNEHSDVELRLTYTFMHEGSLRTLLSKLGQDIGDLAVYWAYGLCFYDSQHSTEVLIDSTIPHVNSVNTQGHILLKLHGGQAQQLAQKLLDKIILDSPFKPNIEWLKGQHADIAPANQTEPDSDSELKEKFTIQAAKRPSRQGDKIPVYVSYTWHKADDVSEAIVDAFYEQLPKTHFTLMQDKKTLKSGQWISSFMRDEIGQGDYVLVVISQRSLQSPYCMQELLELMKYNQQHKEHFLKTVIPIIVDELNISSLADQLEIALHWETEIQKIDQLLEKTNRQLTDFGDEACNKYIKMKKFQSEVVTLLAWLSDVVMPRGFQGVEAAIEVLMARTGISSPITESENT